MILRHNQWSFELDLKGINTLIIENNKHFREVLQNLSDQQSGKPGPVNLFIDQKEKQINKIVHTVFSIFMVNINERKILNKLYKELEQEILSLEYQEYKSVERSILSVVRNVLFNRPEDIDISEEIDVVGLLKLLDIKFIEEDLDIIERLIDYIDAIYKYTEAEIIVLVSSLSLFDDEELEFFIDEMNIKNYNILLLENNDRSLKNMNINKYIIDQDLCFILPKNLL